MRSSIERDLIDFAAERIQESEILPVINENLAKKIAELGERVAAAKSDQIKMAAIEDFVCMLEGVPATHSLRVMVEMLASPHGEAIRGILKSAPASNARIGYFGKLQALSELFTPTRVARITETARYIEQGWGWHSA